MDRRSFCASALAMTLPVAIAPSAKSKGRATARRLVRDYHAAVANAKNFSTDYEAFSLAQPHVPYDKAHDAWDKEMNAAFKAMWVASEQLLDFIWPAEQRDDISTRINFAETTVRPASFLLDGYLYVANVDEDSGLTRLVIVPMSEITSHDG